MNYTNQIKIAVSALVKNKFRAMLTMLGIIIGVGSVIGMLSIGQGSRLNIQNEIRSMGVNLIFIIPGEQERGGVMMGNSGARNLTMKDVTVLQEKSNAISAVSPQVSTSGQVIRGNNNWPTSIYGVNDEYLSIRKYELKDGRLFSDQEMKSLAKVCLLGSTLVSKLFDDNVDPVGQYIRFNNTPLKVIGVLKSKGKNPMGMDQDDMILAPFSTVQRRMMAINHVQMIYCSAISEDKTDLAIEQIETLLRKQQGLSGDDENSFEVRSQAEMISTFSSVSNMLTTLLGAIAGISLLVGGIGIMNIMYVSVTERTREIGLRMSVGGRGIDILMQFLIEAILLSLLGGMFGVLLGVLVSYIAAILLGFPMVIMKEAVILSFLVCSLIGIFFGWYPARKAAQLNPIDAIRYE